MADTESYWWYITLKGLSGQGEVLRSLAEASGCIGSEEDDRPDSVDLRAYYRSNFDLGHWVEILKSLTRNWQDITIKDMGKLENRHWRKQCMEAFPPLNVGENFVVLAPWHRGKEPEGRTAIYINPGSAFGTGYHESTQNVLTLMEKHLKKGSVVADIGCGSGILSIASAKLGASKVFAVDLDPAVLTEVASNADLNGVAPGLIEISEGDLLKGFHEKVDMLLANILLEPLLEMIKDVPKALNPGGTAIYSGITLKEKARFLEGLEKAGLSVLDQSQGLDWCALAVGLKGERPGT